MVRKSWGKLLAHSSETRDMHARNISHFTLWIFTTREFNGVSQTESSFNSGSHLPLSSSGRVGERKSPGGPYPRLWCHRNSFHHRGCISTVATMRRESIYRLKLFSWETISIVIGHFAWRGDSGYHRNGWRQRTSTEGIDTFGMRWSINSYGSGFYWQTSPGRANSSIPWDYPGFETLHALKWWIVEPE